jgi:hypothetical protein
MHCVEAVPSFKTGTALSPILMKHLSPLAELKIKKIKQNLHSTDVYPHLLYLKAAQNYTILYFKNGRKYISGNSARTPHF